MHEYNLHPGRFEQPRYLEAKLVPVGGEDSGGAKLSSSWRDTRDYGAKFASDK